MSGRAKGKRFVIRGKERLDVGLQEDEFLLQAVFYCMGAGPNPARRPSMLAPPRRQSLMPPPGHANRPARILTAGRPCWRPSAGKALSHRQATPTGRPESRSPAAHVGAPPPAKPYPTAGPRQQSGPNPVRRPSMLAPPRRQSLMPPPGHANRPARILTAGRPCWRPSAGKALSHRQATPTGRPESRSPAAHVGAPPSAKPYPTAGPRQQDAPNPARRPSMLAPLRRQSLILPSSHANRTPRIPPCRPSMLAPRRRQSLIPPSGHANRPAQIPPGSRPCWRLAAGKALSHRRATPTGRLEFRLAAVHVGAPSPSKPYATAGPRQQAAPDPACRPSMLALPRRQSLNPPLDHANRPAQIPPAVRPCWRCPAGKALIHRWTTPTGRPKSRPPSVHVGAAPPAKP